MFYSKVRLNSFRDFFLLFLLPLFITNLSAQTPSSVLPDLQYFKINFPVDANGNDNRNVDYEDRSSDYVKGGEVDNLVGYNPSNNYSPYLFVSGNEVVFRAHCAGALTSPNAYPRCELRETPNGTDDLWEFADEHVLNATFKVTNLPNQKREVCMLQIKGNDSNSTSNTEEAFRLEYRADGSQGVHVTINETNTLTDIMDYSVGQTIVATMYVNNGEVTITLNNTNVSGSNGEWSYNYDSDYSHGYFKAGCYTQSSIWEEKNGVGPEDPDAYGEVRFSALSLSAGNGGACTPVAPSNRSTGNVGTSTATVSWNSVANIDHYKVRHRVVGSSSWTTSPSVTNTSYTITGLSSNTAYQWQVRAKCSNTNGSNYSQGNGPNFTTASSGGGTVVTMTKGNATGYAMDGQGGSGANGQNVHLWGVNSNNDNQKWVEISRGGGYYSYQKLNTNYCLDGGNGGADGQNVYLWSCGTSNQNQHWKKVSLGNNKYRLEKRNAPGYSIDGRGGGSNSQNVHLWSSSNTNGNQQWIFGSGSGGGSGSSMEEEEENLIELSADKFSAFPNPFTEVLMIQLPATEKELTAIQIYDMMGRLVFQQRGLNAEELINVSASLAKGVYLIKWLDSAQQLIQSEKVIRN